MNIQILHSWLLEHIKTNATAAEIADSLALCGPSVEKLSALDTHNRQGKRQQDWLYDVEITTNRVDTMSVIGISREIVAILPRFDRIAHWLPTPNLTIPKPIGSQLPLTIKTHPKLTKRVMAIVIDNIVVAQSPQWLQDRLSAAGIRPLNNIIDITNYIMLEIGHPTHVFDYDRISTHQLVFRLSKPGETITTLDQHSYRLPGDDIVIDDGTGTIVDLPGIMGTANSVVTDKTKRIIFFIDNNDPIRMRRTSMATGIRTVAVTLNEKQVDPELGLLALQKGVALYIDLAQGRVASNGFDDYKVKPQPKTLTVAADFVSERVGVEISRTFIENTLQTLGFKVKKIHKEQLSIEVPSWRLQDIAIPEDIVEEVTRIYGYHRLPSLLPAGELPQPWSSPNQFFWEMEIKTALRYWGYWETYSHSLVSANILKDLNLNLQDHLCLKNPLSTEWEYLRTKLEPSLLMTLKRNQDQGTDLQFFELANVYLKKTRDLPNEVLTLGIIHSQNDFYKLKGTIEVLADVLGLSFVFKTTQGHSEYHPDKFACIYVDESPVGWIGEIHLHLAHQLGIKIPPTIGILDAGVICNLASNHKRYRPISKFPPIIEHLTFFNPQHVAAAAIVHAARTAHQLIDAVIIKDAYQDKISLEITYLDMKHTLTDQTIAPIRKHVVKILEKLGLILQGKV